MKTASDSNKHLFLYYSSLLYYSSFSQGLYFQKNCKPFYLEMIDITHEVIATQLCKLYKSFLQNPKRFFIKIVTYDLLSNDYD